MHLRFFHRYSQFIFVFIERVTLKANINSEEGRKIKKSIDTKLTKRVISLPKILVHIDEDGKQVYGT